MLIILWYTLSAMLWLLPRWEPPEKPSLPVEIWMEILSYCDYDVLQRVKRLNKRFKVLVEDSSLAERLFLTSTPDQAREGTPVFLHPLLQHTRILFLHPTASPHPTIFIEKDNRRLLFSHLPLAVLRENATSPPFSWFTSIHGEPTHFVLETSRPGSPLSVDDAVQALASIRLLFMRRWERGRSSSGSSSSGEESFAWALEFKQKEIPSEGETLRLNLNPFIEQTKEDGTKVLRAI